MSDLDDGAVKAKLNLAPAGATVGPNRKPTRVVYEGVGDDPSGLVVLRRLELTRVQGQVRRNLLVERTTIHLIDAQRCARQTRVYNRPP
jgi:hypothetical protein